MDHLLLQADARKIPLRDRSVHMVCTSPPYFNLRQYDTASWVGGDEGCDHAGRFGGDCRKCGATRVDRQIGLEESPAAYVAAIVGVFREVWRVLRDDGVAFINVGDSFSSSPPGNTTVGVSAKSGLNGVNGASGVYRETLAAGHATKRDTSRLAGFKPKDRLGIPHRLVFGLQDDGWYWRDEIVWHKPAPMTESVRDRTTKAHEMVFMLAKRERYFYDAEAIKEEATTRPHPRKGSTTMGGQVPDARNGGQWDEGQQDRVFGEAGVRNKRSVWSVNTAPYKGAHFATMPPVLAETCIKAGSSEYGACPVCGSPWARVVERDRIPTRPGHTSKVYLDPEGSPYEQHSGSVVGNRDPFRHCSVSRTKGWEPACSCPPAAPVPCLVFDPFAGSGTTLLVANRLGRDACGTDLSRNYLSIASDRIKQGLRPVSRYDNQPRPKPARGQTTLFDMGD